MLDTACPTQQDYPPFDSTSASFFLLWLCCHIPARSTTGRKTSRTTLAIPGPVQLSTSTYLTGQQRRPHASQAFCHALLRYGGVSQI